MSKVNIARAIANIKSKTNIYTPLMEAVVNSIEAISETQREDGQILITIQRANELSFDSLASIQSIEIFDNGVGFNQRNRDSFDTYYSEKKIESGGKGFGRFMFLKYFNDVEVISVFNENEEFKQRKFVFGKQYQIVDREELSTSSENDSYTKISFKNVIKEGLLDKEIDTIARKLVEKLLIFFISENFSCPQIILQEEDKSRSIVLNDYVAPGSQIQHVATKQFSLNGSFTNKEEVFNLKVFKIYFAGNQKSKICLTGHNREVTETSLHTYIPEFEDDFFDEIQKENGTQKRNYIIRAYVSGAYLDEHVSLERETFDFEKIKSTIVCELSQSDIEKSAAEVTKEIFQQDVKLRADKKRSQIVQYVIEKAPWHKGLVEDLDFSSIQYNLDDEKIEVALQTLKYKKETLAKKEINAILQAPDEEFEKKLASLVSKVTEIGKNDLAHYVCNRKIVLQIFDDLRKRNDDGKANLEKDMHNIIFPMGESSDTIGYEDHNLWLLDERLVFSEYIASDRKISSDKQKNALDEPDLIVFDQKRAFRNGENEFSNPLTVFEFKRPKRESYKQEDDPILQIAQYVDKIRQGKYEMPGGSEPIKVNNNTPVYGYVVSDLTPKIREFARINQLTVSPDDEGYFGFHSGFRIYYEIMSFKKLMKDANLRNKIFFKKLGVE